MGYGEIRSSARIRKRVNIMFILVVFSFIAGVITVLSPCILPLLPIILSSSVGTKEDSKKPYGIVAGFILSFTFFTLFLALIVKNTGISADSLRLLAVIVIGVFGVSLISDKIQAKFEMLFSKLTKFSPKTQERNGFGGGLLLGLSLGLLWTPCVGPILASVISLAIIGEVSFGALVITLAYSTGTAIPMFMIIKGGSATLKKTPWLVKNSSKIQKVFGVLMVATAIMILFEVDRKFQIILLRKFPNYGTGLTKIEDIKIVKDKLKNFGNSEAVEKGTPANSESMLYPKQGLAPELASDSRWINSEPLTIEELRGKVILVDFWTYSCINCQRTFPYLRQWWEKYRDDGLVIVGVHAPEFEFEKDYDNVLRAANDFGLKYPIVQDNDFKTWRAYNNRYWPAKYLIDKDGFIRFTHFGEGSYDETEKVIQLLLGEAGTKVDSKIDNPNYDNHAKTPETYVGFYRIDRIASPEAAKLNELISFSAPKKLPKNNLAFEGEWYVAGEYANPKSGSNLFLNFNAQKVFLVMNPKTESSEMNVYLDGEFVKKVTVDSDQLYTLVELEQPGTHILKLEFLDDNTEVYAFTFG